MSVSFDAAVPTWISDCRKVWNQMAGFHVCVDITKAGTDTVLRITAADAYRVWVNGVHAGYGPARTAHGHARVDEWRLGGLLTPGENHIAIEVLSHGIDSYIYARQLPFLQAEVISGGEVLAATPDGFSARILPERVQKVERYSKQRAFAEAYRLRPDSNDWRVGNADVPRRPCESFAELALLPRHVPLPTFDCVEPRQVIATGSCSKKVPAPKLGRFTSRDGAGKGVAGYPIAELEWDISQEIVALDFQEGSPTDNSLARDLPAQSHSVYDFEVVQGGFIGIRLRAEAATRVYLMFDEVQGRLFTLGVGAIALDLEPGEYVFESMQPYSLRFLRVVTLDAPVSVETVFVREYVHPESEAVRYDGPDPVLARVFDAARQTFRTNSVDLFTDCPSRERGGYPCDSWFTAMAERVLTAESRVERNFLENYFLPETFSGIPDGMVPHCYPSDRLGNGAYIPNWAMWLLLELTDYHQRTGDDPMRDLARHRVQALVDYFQTHRNELGLLENLPGWVFVEWSPANSLTEGVNFPTNMLYAHCLDALAKMYGRPEWAEQAAETRAAVWQESWDGTWFADQALRVDGVLERTSPRTETCQYHALWTGTREEKVHAGLWQRLRDDWGPTRGLKMVPVKGMSTWELVRDEGVEPRADDTDLAPAGLLYGVLLRLDLLLQHREYERVLGEVRYLFGPQAEQTGTLWEHATDKSSCNHGFASCACHYIQEATKALASG